MIAGVLFSFSNYTLKMSALFPPLHPQESQMATLLLTNGSTGELVATRECDIIPNIWKCGICVDASDLLEDKDQDYAYKIQYQPNNAISCFGNDNKTEKDSLVFAVNALSPDLIVLQGDQAYLRNDLGFGILETFYSISEITRFVPTIVQMDDHDYGRGNLWGADNALEDDSGAGFVKPVCLINAIQELSMGHNPDPATEETLENGITIHYTNYIFGQIDFAVLEARKFKNRNNGDSLLGDEQEEWLQDWCDKNNDMLKVVLTQTPFAELTTHRTWVSQGTGLFEVPNPCEDTECTPEAGHVRAMEILSGCTNLILSGDQHLSISVTYDDYGITECISPAALNSQFWRANYNQVGSTHIDRLGNEYTLNAVWNVNYKVSANYGTPKETITERLLIKQARADGFLLVDIHNMQATCSSHSSYPTALLRSPVWNFTVPLSLPFS